MKKIYVFAAIALVMGLAGCLSTVHPIFTEKDLVFDPKLLGKWRHESKSFAGFVEITAAKPEDFNAHPNLKKVAGKTYMVRYLRNEGSVGEAYFAFLVKLGSKHYMDFFPVETPDQQRYDGFFKRHFTNLHTCFSIHFTKNSEFELKQFDEAYLQKLIDSKKIRIRHEAREGGNMVVTASTEELQQYLIKYSDVPEAYYQDNTSIYTRIANY